jgi:hypothetical protein
VRPAVLSGGRAVPAGPDVRSLCGRSESERGDCGVRSGCGGVLTAARAKRGVGRIRQCEVLLDGDERAGATGSGGGRASSGRVLGSAQMFRTGRKNVA